MVAEGRGCRATGLCGYFNQLLVKTMAAAECMTALTRVSGGPSAFLFCVTRGGRQGGLLSSSRQPRSRAWFPVGHVNANLPVTTHEVCRHEERTETKRRKSVFGVVREVKQAKGVLPLHVTQHVLTPVKDGNLISCRVSFRVVRVCGCVMDGDSWEADGKQPTAAGSKLKHLLSIYQVIT